MEIKDFIKGTVAAIISATEELQQEHPSATINPPTDGKNGDTFEEGGANHVLRRVQNVDFDMAVTASSETSGSAKAGIKIFVAEGGSGLDHTRSREEVSRIRFSLSIALPASTAEHDNRRMKKSKEDDEARKAKESATRLANTPRRSVV